MASEDDDRDQGFEDFTRRKKGSGHIPTERNPKGAGRPSREWSAYKEYEQFKANPTRWLARYMPEVFSGVGGSGAADRGGDTERKPPRIMGRILELFATKKEVEKLNMDKIDQGIYDTAKYVAPHVVPSFVKPLGWALGLSALYVAEEIPKTDKYTSKEWAEMPQKIKDKYYHVETEGETIYATRKLMYPIVHSLVEIVLWLLEVAGSYMKEEYGTNAIGLTRWMIDKPWRFLLGPFAPITKIIQDRRK